MGEKFASYHHQSWMEMYGLDTTQFSDDAVDRLLQGETQFGSLHKGEGALHRQHMMERLGSQSFVPDKHTLPPVPRNVPPGSEYVAGLQHAVRQYLRRQYKK